LGPKFSRRKITILVKRTKQQEQLIGDYDRSQRITTRGSRSEKWKKKKWGGGRKHWIFGMIYLLETAPNA